jgi:hypothetical protein
MRYENATMTRTTRNLRSRLFLSNSINRVIAHPAIVMGTPIKIPSKDEALYLASL